MKVEPVHSGSFEQNKELEDEIRAKCRELNHEVDKVLVGEENFKETMQLCIMTEGSLITEGPPGHGKSLGGLTYSKALGVTHKRIEGVNGLMPFDIQGGVDHRTGKLVHGPIFHQLVLFEEVNRVEGKTKSALLNPMQDGFVSFTDWPEIELLPKPHIIIATYNPSEKDRNVFEMTTAELDRFACRVRLRKKTVQEIEEIAVRDSKASLEKVGQVMNAEDIIRYNHYIRTLARSANHDHPVVNYISRLASYMQYHTHDDEEGASPRAVHSLWVTLTGFRIINGLKHITPEHVEYLIRRCWIHRLIAADKERKNRMIDEALENVSPIP